MDTKTPGDPAVEPRSAIGYISINVQRCAGCFTCEAVCSLSHKGVVSPGFARIIINDDYVDGHRVTGVTCKQCHDSECMRACPTGALHADPVTGARVIDPHACDGCRRCMPACPQYPATPIRFDPIGKLCLKCDLCGGDPLCVKLCPEAALTLKKKR